MTTDIKRSTTIDHPSADHPSADHSAGDHPVALVTGGSAGLGRSLVLALTDRGWRVITDARHREGLAGLERGEVVTVTGDVGDEEHRGRLLREVQDAGRLDLLVHNASTLGPLPMRELARAGVGEADTVWHTNVAAPLQLTRDLLAHLVASGGTLVAITSDAAVEHDETWGLYGATKAALEHVTLTFGAENPAVAAYAVDPGDMRTAMHQAAFPGEDISDRPLPDEVVPHLLGLLDARPPSGRYRARDVAPSGSTTTTGALR